MSTDDEAAAVHPSIDLAIAANLASRYSIEPADGITRHPAYSEAVGDGHFDVGIYLPTINREYGSPTMQAITSQRRMSALAAITGANYTLDGLEWRIWAKGSATDFEEDRSYYADIHIGLMTPLSASYGRSVYVGVLLNALLYPLGIDPLTIPADDGPAGASRNWCTECTEQHPYARFTPPERDDLTALGQPLVIVEIAPRGWHSTNR